jgi:hypothetical protein
MMGFAMNLISGTYYYMREENIARGVLNNDSDQGVFRYPSCNIYGVESESQFKRCMVLLILQYSSPQ